MAALDAGYDVRASGVTIDRFCGSGITSVNLAAATIMSGMSDLDDRRGHGNDELHRSLRRSESAPFIDAGNLRLRARHPQSHQGVCADAIATLEGISREDLDALALESQVRADKAIKGGHFDKSLVPVHKADGSLALDREEFPRPQTTARGPRRSQARLRDAGRRLPLNEQGETYWRPHPPSLSRPQDPAMFITPATRRAWSMARPPSCWPRPSYAEEARPRGRERACVAMANMGDSPTLMLNAPVPRRAEGAREGRPDGRRHRPVRDQRGLRASLPRNSSATSSSTATRSM